MYLRTIGVIGGLTLPVYLLNHERSKLQDQIDALESLRKSIPSSSGRYSVNGSSLASTSTGVSSSLIRNNNKVDSPLIQVEDYAGSWWNRMVIAGHTQAVRWCFAKPEKPKE